MALDQRAQAEPLVQLAREQQPSIGGHRGSSELDAELRIEREANRARCRVTHWVVPSAPARSPREPRFMRALSDYGPLRSAFKSKMWAHTHRYYGLDDFNRFAVCEHHCRARDGDQRASLVNRTHPARQRGWSE
jgi:hypothetical protein